MYTREIVAIPDNNSFHLPIGPAIMPRQLFRSASLRVNNQPQTRQSVTAVSFTNSSFFRSTRDEKKASQELPSEQENRVESRAIQGWPTTDDVRHLTFLQVSFVFKTNGMGQLFLGRCRLQQIHPLQVLLSEINLET